LTKKEETVTSQMLSSDFPICETTHTHIHTPPHTERDRERKRERERIYKNSLSRFFLYFYRYGSLMNSKYIITKTHIN